MDTLTTSSWQTRIVSAEEAVSVIRPGERVFVGSACATPLRLLEALEERSDVPGVQLVQLLTAGSVGLAGREAYTRFKRRAFYVGRDLRGLWRTPKLDYVPISLARVPWLLETGRLSLDVALVQVSPPDPSGHCSLGVSVDVTLAAVRHARRVIAEVNPWMPRTRGTTTVPAERIESFVLVNEPVIEVRSEPVDDVAERIARFVARVVDDGSTLHLSLGRIPSDMLRYLTSRRDLGIHSDVLTDSVLDLVEKGVVTGARKTLQPGLVVASLCIGTRRLYDFVNENPLVSLQPLDVVCNPAVIAANERMVSVTQAHAVDLTGQVATDQVDGHLSGGVGTALDFARGAAAAHGGKPIVCLSSRDAEGRARIRPALGEGEAVSIPRADAHYVVTEYGVAYLFGKSLAERAVALVELAHPDDRDDLLREAKRLGYLGADVAIRSKAAYPSEEERVVPMKDGTTLRLRPTRAGDVDLIQDLFYSLSEEDVYTRFFTNLSSLSDSRARHLCSVGYQDEMAFVAVVGDAEREKAVGTGCYYVNQATNMADVAYMIRPDFQGRGVATLLQRRLIEHASSHGIRGFTADVLHDNEAMLRVFEKSGCQMSHRVASGVREVTLLFPTPPPPPRTPSRTDLPALEPAPVLPGHEAVPEGDTLF